MRLSVRWSGSGKGRTISPSSDRFIFTSPRLKIAVTDLDDPSKTLTLNVPGAFHRSIEANGDVLTVVTGRNLLGDPEAGMVLAIGTFSYIFDSAKVLCSSLFGNGTAHKSVRID